MDFQSILSLIIFALFLLVITVAGFSFTFSIFKKLPDRGFGFTKMLIILILSYFIWLISHIGPFFTTSVVIIFFIAISVTSLSIYYKKRANIIKFLRENKRIIIFEEIIFISFFVLFLLIRIGNPDLWHPVMGGEKPMDFAFINALIRTDTLPPYDPWLAGYTINYYYFGQFITATLSKLLNIPTVIIYNLFLAFLFGQTAVGFASIIYNLIKSKTASLIGSILLLISGNLAQIPLIFSSFAVTPPINAWYWTASRVMQNNEINEFPFFTFLYADLHSHLISLPISLLFIVSILEIYKLLTTKNIKRAVLLTIFASFILGIMRITNIWDYPTYLFIGSAALFLTIFLKEKVIRKKIILSLVFPLILLFVSSLSIFPFLLHYKTGELGLAIYKGPFTLINDYLLIHGLFLCFNFILLLFIINPKRLLTFPKFVRLIFYIPFVLIIIFLLNSLYFLAFLSFLIFIALLAITTNPKEKYIVPVFFFISALFLTIIPDVIDIKLGLGRMNTVFKFYFQAWIFFALSSTLANYYIYNKLKDKKIFRSVFILFFTLTLLVAFTYPLTATPAKILDRMGNDRKLTLNGMHFMKTSFYSDKEQSINLSDDLKAINWINENINGSPVIAEANTPLYRWGSRISIYTGLPTILGWDWHEIAHRQYMSAEEIQKRAAAIKQIYESSDFETTKSLLMLYNVSYIYLGQLEKAYYDTSGIEKIINDYKNSFIKVYNNSNISIYKFLNGKSD